MQKDEGEIIGRIRKNEDKVGGSELHHKRIHFIQNIGSQITKNITKKRTIKRVINN